MPERSDGKRLIEFSTYLPEQRKLTDFASSHQLNGKLGSAGPFFGEVGGRKIGTKATIELIPVESEHLKK